MGLAAKRETGSEEEEAEKRRRGRERREIKGHSWVFMFH